MRNSKSSESVIEILHSMIESDLLKPEQRQTVVKALRKYRKTQRTGNHREVIQAVDELCREIVSVIRNQGE